MFDLQRIDPLDTYGFYDNHGTRYFFMTDREMRIFVKNTILTLLLKSRSS